jgi:hypothetical protein
MASQMGLNGQRTVVLCSLNATSNGAQKNCGPGYVCAPLSHAELAASAQFDAQTGSSQLSLDGQPRPPTPADIQLASRVNHPHLPPQCCIPTHHALPGRPAYCLCKRQSCATAAAG